MSSTAHGNDNTINTLIQTPEKNLHKLEEDLTKSIAFFEATLESALKCYVRLYLGRNVDHGEIVKSMFPDKGIRMENEKPQEKQEIAIVPSGEATAELIPQPTAELIEKSFAENTVRNRRHALEKFDEWLRGRPITDGLLAQYITGPVQ